jgi:energy-coupling factor transporter ATP-binding protein EcfA2
MAVCILTCMGGNFKRLMHIEKLEIHGFGKLSNLTMNIKNGFNLIYGPNESGKTTLQWFIRGMLFGLKGGRTTKEEGSPPLRKFKPWDGSTYGGALEYRLDNDQFYRVERDFERGKTYIYDSMFNDVTSEFYSSTERGSITVEKHIYLNEVCFEKTGFIKQMNSGIDDAGKKELLSKITNVIETGFEDISFRKAEKALKDSIIQYIGSDRTTTRPLDRVNLRLEELKGLRNVLIEKREEFDEITQKLDFERKSLKIIREDMEFLKKVEDVLKIKKEFEKCRRQRDELNSVLEESLSIEQKITEASKELEELEDFGLSSEENTRTSRRTIALKRKRKVYIAGAIFFVITFLALIIFDFFLRNIWIKAFTGVFVVLTALASYLTSRNLRDIEHSQKQYRDTISKEQQYNLYIEKANMVMELRKILNEEFSKASLISRETINSIEDIKEIQHKLEDNYMELLNTLKSCSDSIRAYYQNNSDMQINICDIEKPSSNSDIESMELMLEYNLRKKEAEYDSSMKNITEYEVLIRTLESDKDELQKVDEEIEELNNKKKSLESLNFSLRTALDVLTEASREIQKDHIPKLNNKLSRIIEKITNDKYSDVRSDEKLHIRAMSPEIQKVADINLLSRGTVDQIYLALRLSMAEMIENTDEKVPFFMDEIFAHYDDIRMSNSLRLLEEISLQRQVILFTCKEREVEEAFKIFGEGLNIIKL